jgi:hypothetical protein
VYEDLGSFYMAAKGAPRLFIDEGVDLSGFRVKWSTQFNGGKGVFTTRPVKAHQILMQFPGEVGAQSNGNAWSLKIGTSQYVNVKDGGTHVAHFINSGVSPNVMFVKVPTSHGPCVVVVALVALATNQELFADYYDDIQGKFYSVYLF